MECYIHNWLNESIYSHIVTGDPWRLTKPCLNLQLLTRHVSCLYFCNASKTSHMCSVTLVKSSSESCTTICTCWTCTNCYKPPSTLIFRFNKLKCKININYQYFSGSASSSSSETGFPHSSFKQFWLRSLNN